MASRHSIKTQSRSIWWWLFCAPGAAFMWIQYMYPGSVRDSFGSARRKDVVLFQFIATLMVYAILFLALTHMGVVKQTYATLVQPWIDMVSLMFTK